MAVVDQEDGEDLLLEGHTAAADLGVLEDMEVVDRLSNKVDGETTTITSGVSKEANQGLMQVHREVSSLSSYSQFSIHMYDSRCMM